MRRGLLATALLFIAQVVALAAAAAPVRNIFVRHSTRPLSAQHGTAFAPFNTITQALQLARRIRFGCPANQSPPSNIPITIHVAAGTYFGAFEPPQSGLETLPLLLNVPHLKLRGALRFDAGAIVPGTRTILRPVKKQQAKQHMVVVTRMNPTAGCGFPVDFLMAGNFVTISGFLFEGMGRDGSTPNTVTEDESALVSIDGVGNFVVSGNYFTHAVFGITARLSRGTIENNQFIDNRGLGLNVSGGSDSFPAKVKIFGNVLTDNGTFSPTAKGGGINLQGAAQTENDLPDLFDAQHFRRVPLPRFYSRTHPHAVPDKLNVSVLLNKVSGSATFGIHVHGYIRNNYEFDPSDLSFLTANVRALFRGNVCTKNGNYGIVIDAGQIRKENIRTHRVNIDATLISTTFAANVSGEAVFSFWRFGNSVSPPPANEKFKFAHDSTMRICGEAMRFRFENRPIDPIDGTPTNNTLIVNGEELEKVPCVPPNQCPVTTLPVNSSNCSDVRPPLTSESQRAPASLLLSSAR